MNSFQLYIRTNFIVIPILSVVLGCGEEARVSEEVAKEESEQKEFTNPVVDQNFPDPTVIKAHDGYFYVYATNSEVNGVIHNMQVRRSKDLIDWEVLRDAMPEKPTWGSGDFWAPHVMYDQGMDRYLLYYSGESTDTDVGKCLGIAVANSPEGPFVDLGQPMLCGESFVNIDPMVFVEPDTGEKYFYWGSGHEPIMVQALEEDGTNFKAGSQAIAVIQPVHDDSLDNYENLVEGAWVIKKNGFYYLFYSGDNCCGDQAHYAVMVARSKSPNGPFEKYKNAEGNSVILKKNEAWIAPGHNSLIQDEQGTYWMAYHAIDANAPNAGRKMLLDKVSWKDGWPYVNNGTPSTGQEMVPSLN
ncbi:family 43 glycosylhydrolase [Salinimicrobium sp. CDJ15-81-2]|nr:family 43 glycosylhydrolase [Salinimicrobium nanhaiense]